MSIHEKQQDANRVRKILHLDIALITFLICGAILVISLQVNAATPNPGHDFHQVGGGVLQGDILFGSNADLLSTLNKDSNTSRYLSNGGENNNPAWSQIRLSDGVAGVLPTTNGGTGYSTYIIGDLLYASTESLLTPLAAVASGYVLISEGVGTAPKWNKVELGENGHVIGNLPVTHLNSGAGASVDTFWRGDGVWAVPNANVSLNGTTTIATSGTFSGASYAVSADAVCNPSGVCSTTLTDHLEARVSGAIKIKNLTAYISNSPTNANTCTFTVREAPCGTGAYTETSLSCTVTAGANYCVDTLDTVSIKAGQCLQIYFDENNSCSGFLNWSFDTIL